MVFRKIKSLAKISDSEKTKSKYNPIINTFSFEELIKHTVSSAAFLAEFFRLNLIYYQLISGKGLEFDRIKEYNPGDDPKRIDWKIYARTNELHIRVYKEERNLDIIIILDGSDSMLLGSKKWTKNEYGSIIAGVLAFAAVEAGDNVGGGVFGGDTFRLIESESDFVNLINVLCTKDFYGGPKDFDKLGTEMMSTYPDNSIVFLISDFIDIKPEKFLPELSKKFARVYGIMVRDPLDNQLPKGVGKMYMRDPSTGKVILTDLDHIRKEYELLSRLEVERIKDVFHQHGERCFEITTGEEFGKAFIKAMGDEEVEIS